MTLKYNLGCGPSEILVGYVNCDTFLFQGVDVKCPLWELRDTNYKKLMDESIEEIRASHVLEHIASTLLTKTLQEWWRVLKPGGCVSIYCPDAALIFSDYLAKTICMEEASRLLFGEQDFSGNTHRLCFDRDRLEKLVSSHGFTVIGREGRPDAYRYELGVQCSKVK